MSLLVQKWIDTFHINDSTREPMHYSICNHILSKFRDITEDTLTDYCNEEEINKRVTNKTKESTIKIQELSSSCNGLQEEKETLTHKLQIKEGHINHLQGDIDDCRNELSKEKLNTSQLIQEAISKTEIQHKEYKESFNERTTDYIEMLKSQIKELKNDKETLTSTLTSVVKEQGNSSYDKGVEGEDVLLDILQESGEFTVIDTHNDNHKGDAVIKRNNKTSCIDSKNHTRSVPRSDVDKLITDIELNKFDGGAIIAWNAPIYDPFTSAKIKQQICYKMISSKPILFISKAKEISHEALISLLMNLEDHLVSDESFQTIQNYDKIKEKLITIATKELKRIDSHHNSLTRQISQNTKERHYWMDVLSEENAETESVEEESSEEGSCDTDDFVTDISSLINDLSDESLEQRNSTKDILTYLNEYCKYHNHELSEECSKLSIGSLKDILQNTQYQLEQKQGHNYLNKSRPRGSPTWNISFHPITK